MMEEAARSRLDPDFVPFARDIEPVERLNRAVRLALDRAEGGKVVAADQMGSTFGHCLGIERGRDVPDLPAL